MVFRFLSSIDDIDPDSWDAMLSPDHSPFLAHRWIRAFEASGSMNASTGWQPMHLVGYADRQSAEQGQNPCYALVLYGKSHSWGEFVFDFAWSDVAKQLGQEYYPKAVALVPATPVTVYRDLGNGGTGQDGASGPLTEAVEFLDQRLPGMGLHSLSFVFLEDDFALRLEELGFARWVHQGFRWDREQMNSFDEYLGRFTKGQRKNIRKERRSMQDQGISIQELSGSELNADQANDMYELYEQLNDQFGPWGAKFLNREFFIHAFEHCADDILLINAVLPDGSVAARSMLVQGAGTLYGRYWGSRAFFRDVHFNLCYYQPIDYAIRRGIERFDPGMGGEHKIRRGFRAVEQYSMHRFYNPILDSLFKTHIGQFNDAARSDIQRINEQIPYQTEEG